MAKKALLNGWTKTAIVILGIVGILVGWGIATGKLYSKVDSNSEDVCDIKNNIVPKVYENEKNISNIQGEMEYIVEGLKFISNKQEKMSDEIDHKFEKQTELQMEILNRLPNE